VFNAYGKAAFGIVLFSLGVRLTLASSVAVSGTASVSKQNRTIPRNGENALQPKEPTRCSGSPKLRKEISCLEHASREASREGNYSEAELLLKQELTIVEKQLPQADPGLTRVLGSLALT